MDRRELARAVAKAAAFADGGNVVEAQRWLAVVVGLFAAAGVVAR